MNADDFPAPSEGFVITHFLVVSDQDRSREFYRSLLGGTIVLERDPVILRVANSWLILNVGGGPTDDKPDVTLVTPEHRDRTSAFLNVRVADIEGVYRDWTAKGAEFLTAPKDHGRESAPTSEIPTATSSRWARRPASPGRTDPGNEPGSDQLFGLDMPRQSAHSGRIGGRRRRTVTAAASPEHLKHEPSPILPEMP